MTITIEKKHFFILLGIIVLCVVFLLIGKILFRNKVDYETTARDIKLNSYIVVEISSEILRDYHKVWGEAIDGTWVKDEKGKSHYCLDFNDAISYRKNYYLHEGYFDILDSISDVVKDDLKLINDASDEYQDVQKAFVDMYGDMNSMVSLSKEPKGSLMTFGFKIDELMMNFEKNFKETDLKCSVSENELKEKVIKVYETISLKRIDDRDEGFFSTENGKIIPNFKMRSYEGKEVCIMDFVKQNRITILDFWASWCQPCREEMPFMKQLLSKYQGKGIGIVGISLDEDEKDWTNCIERLNLIWPQLSDLKGTNSTIVSSFDIQSIPFTAVIDQKGKILAKGLRGEE